MSIGSARVEWLAEAEKALNVAEMRIGRERLGHLQRAVQFFLDAGAVGRARALERLILKESRAGLGMKP